MLVAIPHYIFYSILPAKSHLSSSYYWLKYLLFFGSFKVLLTLINDTIAILYYLRLSFHV